jgi:protein gp37
VVVVKTKEEAGGHNPEMQSGPGTSWNIVTGCNPYSDGCLHCWAKDVAAWQGRLRREHYVKNGFNVAVNESRRNWPLSGLPQKPRTPVRSWVTEMGDLFHEKVPDDFIRGVFGTLQQVPQHRFYVLTKRAERLAELGANLPWRPWIWAGVTIESDKYVHRLDLLNKLPPAVNKFVIFEPLLSAISTLEFEGVQWIVVGGETGKIHRPMEEDWVRGIRDQARAAGIPFLFKHWPGLKHNSREALLDGRTWAEYPETLLTNNVPWMAGDR